MPDPLDDFMARFGPSDAGVTFTPSDEEEVPYSRYDPGVQYSNVLYWAEWLPGAVALDDDKRQRRGLSTADGLFAFQIRYAWQQTALERGLHYHHLTTRELGDGLARVCGRLEGSIDVHGNTFYVMDKIMRYVPAHFRRIMRLAGRSVQNQATWYPGVYFTHEADVARFTSG